MSLPTVQQSKPAKITSWVLQVIAALILLSTVLPKLTGAEMAVGLFSSLGVEPWGRYATGILELLTAALLLLPLVPWLGAVLALGIMAGAITSHLFVLGIAVNGDPSMFVMALVVTAASAIVLLLRRTQIPVVGARFRAARQPDAASA